MPNGNPKRAIKKAVKYTRPRLVNKVYTLYLRASQVALVVKNQTANAGNIRDTGSIPGSGRSPGGAQQPTVFLPGESYGQRSLAGYSPKGCKESDTTEAT